MAKDLNAALRGYEKKRRQRKAWHKVLWILGCLVVFCTTYALILPAVTEEHVTYCGLEEHTHADACYEDGLVCELEEDGHTHGADCFTTGQVPVCGLEEDEAHTHSDACYEERQILTCGLEETEGHVHTESCYGRVLICGQEEHTHSLACFSNPAADVETAEVWEGTFGAVEQTGEPAADLLAIAETQLGYRESAENYIVLEDGVTVKGYTRYGHWYGGGESMEFAYGDWCAMFASFCLHYAGIPAAVFPRAADCPAWVEALEALGLYQAAAESAYMPREGDLVFFDDADAFGQRDGIADRVGIVSGRVLDDENETEDGGYPVAGFTAIEGDSGDRVAEREYALADAGILGYGVLPRSDYRSLYDAMAEILEEIRTMNPENDEEAQALCLDACMRLGDLLDSAYDACGAGQITEEELGSLEALYEEALAWMLDAYGFDPYGISLAAYSEVTDVTLRAYVSKYDPTGSQTINGYTRTAIAEKAVQVAGTLANGDSRKDCLIPVSWLLEQYGAYGYTFDETNPGTSPFVSFASTIDGVEDDAYASNTAMVATSYVQEDGVWYVRVTTSASGNVVNSYSLYYTILEEAADTVTPSSTVIHLFDYWSTADRTGSDNHSSSDAEMEQGINKGHALKFGRNIPGDTNTGYGDINYSWGGTNTPSRVTQGIVTNTLGSDGYPQFSGESTGVQRSISKIVQYLGTQESLAYLFDPTMEAAGKVSFSDVSGLLTRNAQGYYSYDCTERAVELDEATGSITEYTSPAAYYSVNAANSTGFGNGQFFPFNDAHQSALLQVTNDPMNHYFGMSMTTRFIQSHDGYTSAEKNLPMTFDFSGDNDVWIYIDGVLVADLGGLRSAASVSINFVTGEVTIDDMYGAKNGSTTPTQDTTIWEAFEAALDAGDSRLASSKWRTYTVTGENETETTYTTFANNTTHTLKFYYLERGNYDSNLKLTFNLTEIPPTSIYKVDQYGKKLTGAVFAVYQAVKEADGTYEYILDAKDSEGKTQTSAWQSGWYAHPENGKVYASETAYKNGEAPIITPAYCDVTDENGDMVFVDADDAPYTMAELQGMFGDHFILREVHIPAGYRTVTDEVYLYTDGSTIFCEDPYKTGVWASPNAMVTATNKLYKVSDHSVIDYYNVDAATTNGTLFAVVLKRNGLSLSSIDSWYPVYGSDEVGYTVVGENGVYTDTVTGEDGVKTTITYDSQIEAVIAAAQKAQAYGDTIFRYSASGMQVMLENLPGKPERYYTYMQQQNGGALLTVDNTTDLDPQYFVAYYWTEDTLDKATEKNTFRVISRDGILNGQTVTTTDENGNTVAKTEPDYSGFSIQWGTTIEVPNLENRLFVQKLDTAGELVNGATFALYEVYDATPRTESGQSYGYNYIYYNGTDADGNAVWVGLLDNSATPQPGRAIVFGGGTADTHVLGRGDYTTDKVTGVITVTLDTLGSRGDAKVGDTYTVCPATNANGISLITTSHDECDYVKEKGTGHFDHLKSGKYYLREISAPAGYTENRAEIPVLVNDNGVYANAGVADDGVAVGNGVGYLTKTLDVFASVGEIDETLSWVYGALIENDAKDFSAFDAVSGDVLHVGEGSSTTSDKWHFVKQSGDDPDGYGTGESDNRSDAMVTYLYYDGALASAETSSALFDYSPNADQNARTAVKKSDGTVVTPPSGWISTKSGEGTRRLYTDSGWSDMAIYQDYAYGFAQISTNATTNYDDLTDYGNISNLFSSSTFVQVTDERAADLVVKKVDMANENTLLSGAQFRLRRLETVTGETETKTIKTYYSRSESGAVQWVEDETQATVVTTGSDGLGKVFSSLKDGSYYLEEIHAPDGYNLLSGAVEVKVSGGKLTLTNPDTSGIRVDGGVLDEAANRYVYTVTIPNSTGYALPATGGMGAAAICRLGILLMLGAGALLLLRKRACR